MAEARKLKSGNWRCRAYDKETGKQKSFTAATKTEAEYLARQWLILNKPKPKSDKTIGECIDDYIKLKENILSVSTVDKYRRIKQHQLSDKFLNIKLSRIDANAVQSEVNRMAGTYAPKTVNCAHGLISSVLRTYYPDLKLSTTLPKIQRRKRELPTAEKVIEVFRGTELELVVLLGMWQGLRVSEIRGLRKSDFKDGKFTVNRIIVTVNNEHIEKETPKTVDSRRSMRVPPRIQELVDQVQTEYITELSGQAIYKRFKRAMLKEGYDMTFHDLRHLNASIMLALNVPDKYAMERGGWSTTSTLKQIYQETFSDERKAVDDRIDKYFESAYKSKLDTKIDTKPRKRRKFHIIKP